MKDDIGEYVWRTIRGAKVKIYKDISLADSFKIHEEQIRKKLEKQLEEQSNKIYNTLSDNEKLSLIKYSNQNFDEINKELTRTKGDINKLSNNVYEDISNIDNVMNKSTINKDIIVYKGTNKALYKDYKIGDEFTLDIYNSSSLSPDIANGFNQIGHGEYKEKACMLEIKVPKGTKGIYLGENSHGSYESELLLNRGLTYKIVKKEKMIAPDKEWYWENGNLLSRSKTIDKYVLKIINSKKRGK